MTVRSGPARLQVEGQPTLVTGQRNEGDDVKMRNAWYTTAIAVVIWLIIAIMNVANLVLLGEGQ